MAEYNTTSHKSFSQHDAAQLIEIAKLPETYEAQLLESGDHEKALAKMKADAPQHLKDGINLIRTENTTAVIAHDKNTNTLTIAFDPTLSKGTVFNNADKWDNFMRGKEQHSLGGEVHGGLYSDIVKDNSENIGGMSMIEIINGIIYDYASKAEQDLNVNYTGFSKGGAQAALAAGESVASGIFHQNPNIKLNNVYSFAPPGYGDEIFINNFNEQTNALGVNAWTIELHGDTLPTVLTPQGSNHFTQYDYNQFGNRAYMTITDDGIRLNTNPSTEELTTLRAAPVDGNNYHNTESYVKAVVQLGQTEPYKDQNQERTAQTPTVNTAPPSGYGM